MSQQTKVCIAVFTVALAIRVITVAALLPELRPDANWDYYRDIGRNIAAGNGFVAVDPSGRLLPNVMRPPGYPVLIAALVKLGGDNLGLFLSVNCVLAAITSALTVVLALRWLSLRAAAVAGVLSAIDPDSVVRCATVMSDWLFIMLLTLGVCVLAWRPVKLWAWFLAGLMWSLAVLCRPIGIWLWGVAVIVAFAERRRLAHVALFLAGFLPLIGLWTARNAMLTGHWFFSTAPTYNMVVSWASAIKGRETGQTTEAVQHRYLKEFGDLEFYDGPRAFDERIGAYRRIAREVMRPVPFLMTKEAVLGWGKLLLGPGQRALELWVRKPDRGPRWWAIPYTLALAVLVALAVWGTIRLKRAAVLPAALIVYCVVSGGGPGTNSRFRCPIIPELAILAVAGVVGGTAPTSRQTAEPEH